MPVEARFYIDHVTQTHRGSASGWAHPAPAGEVVMRVVTRGEHNSQWASATPSGEFKMTVRSEAVNWFIDRVGKEVRIVIDERPEEELG